MSKLYSPEQMFDLLVKLNEIHGGDLVLVEGDIKWFRESPENFEGFTCGRTTEFRTGLVYAWSTSRGEFDLWGPGMSVKEYFHDILCGVGIAENLAWQSAVKLLTGIDGWFFHEYTVDGQRICTCELDEVIAIYMPAD